MESLRPAAPLLGVVCVAIGGMYTGVSTPVEASSVGAFLIYMVALAPGSTNAETLLTVILQTMSATTTVFLIIIGAFVFIPFMSATC